MLNGFGTTELIIIAVLIFLFFGGKKMKELARGLGESSKEVKKIKKEIKGSKKVDQSEEEE